MIKLPIKALSINKAFQGRRFMTPEYKQFCLAMAYLLLPYKHLKYTGEIVIHYRFYMSNYKMSDADNCIKTTQDCLVKSGIIPDDRFIVKYIIEKFPSETDSIEIDIRGVL